MQIRATILTTILFTLQLVVVCSFAQQKLTPKKLVETYNYCKQQKDAILAELLINYDDVNVKNLIMVPNIKVDYLSADKLFFKFSNHILMIDTANSEVYQYDASKNFDTLELRLIKSSFSESRLAMIKKSLNKNDNTLFLIYFFDKDIYVRNALLTLDSNSVVTYSNETINSTSAIENIITHDFYSIDKYLLYKQNIIDQKIVDKKVKKLSETFTLVDNWVFYADLNPVDTVNNISLLLRDIKKVTQTSKRTINKIEKDLLLILKDTKYNGFMSNKVSKDYRYYNVPFISFLYKDILGLLQKHLSTKALKKYLVHYKIIDKLAYKLKDSFKVGFPFLDSDINYKRFIKKRIKIKSTKPFSYTITNELKTPAYYFN